MKGYSTNAQGFTLIETCIAMVVMMVVGLGATSLFLYSMRSNAGGNNRSQALAIAQQRLEELRTLTFNDPQLALGESTSTVVLQNVAAVSSGGTTSAANGGAVTAFGSNNLGSSPSTSTPEDEDEDENSGGESSYKVLLEVQGSPAGSATPTQKRITITVTPDNGYGAASWINQNPVVIVLHRSSPATGPYRQ